MFLQMFFKCVFLLSLITMIVLSFYKDALPPPKNYQSFTLPNPEQTETKKSPFEIMVNKEQYLITPKFDYDLYGVVVSYNNANGFADIWHYDIWKDFINIRDLCVIWNPNVESGLYQQVYFSSDSWTCWANWSDSRLNQEFKFTALSNNHLVTNNPDIQSAVMGAELGDVIHFKGSLVSYKNLNNGGFRDTSIRRDDTGNGACETVFLDEFKVLQKANPTLRNLFFLSKWTAIISFVFCLIFFFKNPFVSKL